MDVQIINPGAESLQNVTYAIASQVVLRSGSDETHVDIQLYDNLCVVTCSITIQRGNSTIKHELKCSLSFHDFNIAFDPDAAAVKRSDFLRRTPDSDPDEEPAVFFLLPGSDSRAFMVTLTVEIWEQLEPMLMITNPEAAAV